LWFPYLIKAYADVGQFDDAWRSIGEAMTTMETTKERSECFMIRRSPFPAQILQLRSDQAADCQA